MSQAPDSPAAPATEVLELRPATEAEIPLIQTLAHRIWAEVYPGIISPEQIEFMLGWMYSGEQLQREIREEEVRFFLLCREGSPIGFAALGPGEQPHEAHLHKLYLLPEFHGQGLGSAALARLKEQARSRGARHLSLRVNRKNHNAIRCYQRCGFRIERHLVSSIGGGFVMDDHWMRADL